MSGIVLAAAGLAGMIASAAAWVQFGWWRGGYGGGVQGRRLGSGGSGGSKSEETPVRRGELQRRGCAGRG
jgi:hypothetical protein